MKHCYEWLAGACIAGMFGLGAVQWLFGAARRRQRDSRGWLSFTHGLLAMELEPTSMADIRSAVAELAEEQGLSQEWQDRFVVVIRSRVRQDGYATLDYAISTLRLELNGY